MWTHRRDRTHLAISAAVVGQSNGLGRSRVAHDPTRFPGWSNTSGSAGHRPRSGARSCSHRVFRRTEYALVVERLGCAPIEESSRALRDGLKTDEERCMQESYAL